MRKLRIDAEQAGQRIDNFLRRMLPGVPKGRIYRILRKGEVRVNGGRVKAEYRLLEDDEVRIPPVVVREEPVPPPAAAVQDIESRILYEDQRLLVVDKPSGVAVHGGSGVNHGVIERLRIARPACKDLSLAHRLDRETSGCLVLTKRRSALRRLHAQFRESQVEKNYFALVTGDWQHGDVVIDQPLLVNHRQGGERHVVVSPDGKPARTRVRLSRRFSGCCLVQCVPETGRTHQIRVHLAHAGHPIVGDVRYGNAATNREFAKRGMNRLFLHAQSIAFPDDGGNERLFTAPMPESLVNFMNQAL
ncbi:MAG: RluA family pseudouridine synthase [Pseudomonadota bacterium]